MHHNNIWNPTKHKPKQADYIIMMLTKQKAKNQVSHGMISFFALCDDDGNDRMCWNHHMGIFDGLTHGRFRGNHAFVKHHLSFCSCPSPDSVCVCVFVCDSCVCVLRRSLSIVHSKDRGVVGAVVVVGAGLVAGYVAEDDDYIRRRWGSAREPLGIARFCAHMDIRTKYGLVNVGIVFFFFFRFPKTEKPTKHTNTNTKHIQWR